MSEPGHTPSHMPDHDLHRWLLLVYGHGFERPQPEAAARLLAAMPDLPARHPIAACAVGDVEAIRRAVIARQASQAAAGTDTNPVEADLRFTCADCHVSFARPPLVAVTHSSLVRLAPFKDGLHAAADLLLDAGANPNQAASTTRWPARWHGRREIARRTLVTGWPVPARSSTTAWRRTSSRARARTSPRSSPAAPVSRL